MAGRGQDPVIADVRVSTLQLRDPEACARWDTFVRSQPAGTAFHLTAWARAIEEGLGHAPHYLVAERGGEITGVLPLIHVRSRLFGDTLVSNAFAVYGGVLAVSAEAHAALDAAAEALARSIGVKVVELRHQSRQRPDWTAKDQLYATFRRPLSASSDENLKAIPRKQRAEVRKSLDKGLTVTVGHGERDLRAHFEVYATSVRNLGTPVFPQSLFRALIEAYGDDADILTVWFGAKPVASVLSLYEGGEVLPYYGGGIPEARDLRANDHMYWMLMEHARERGCSSFDFGRSKAGTGPYSFKKNWGFEPAPLAYEFLLLDGAEMPDLNPLNPKYRLMVAAWKRLPVPVANRLGPLVSRSLG